MGRWMVALLTDFGTRDGYAGIMRAVLLRRTPRLRVVDLSHDIEPHCLLSGAYVLSPAWEQFPRGTVFCAVVRSAESAWRTAVCSTLTIWIPIHILA